MFISYPSLKRAGDFSLFFNAKIGFCDLKIIL